MFLKLSTWKRGSDSSGILSPFWDLRTQEAMFLQLSCWLRFTFCFCPWILRLLWLFCFFNVWLLCAFVVSGSCGSCGLVYLYHADWFAVSSLSIIVSIVYFGRHVLFAEKKHTTYTSNTFGPWCQKCQ